MMRLGLLAAALAAARLASPAGARLECRFDGSLRGVSGRAPAQAKGVQFVPGRQGQAALIDRPAVLTYPAKGFNPNAFTVSFWVRHEKPLSAYYFRRLTYFYHETPDLKNRIGLMKRAGSNRFVFFLSDGRGRAKGNNFGGDWFAMETRPLEWPAGSWHHIVCAADKAKRVAQLVIDGRKEAEARGDQLPQRVADAFWIGTQQGHSWMRGAMDDLRVEAEARLDDSPLVQGPAGADAPPTPAPRILGASVGRLTGKEFTINLDFFDICIGTDAWNLRRCDAEMNRLMALCAHYGVDRVLFRVSVCGAVCYHTKVMTPAFEDVFARYKIEGLDGCCANIPSLHRRMGAVMRRIDPLAMCAKYAHAHGMKVYAWVTIFDSMYYAPPTEFFQRHPEYTWASKDGKKHIPGVPCYAYPQVRAYRLRQMKELLGYDIDGLFLSIRSHSPWPGRGKGGGNEGARGYGFNEPVVKEYIRRFGKDPRQARPDSLDELRFVQLKGDFLTQFLREVKRVTAAAGKRLALNFQTHAADPVRATWMYVDADTLARERVVDELCLMGSAGADLDHWRLLADGKIKMTTWASIHGYTYEQCRDRMRSQLRAMLDNPTSDGSAFHELANLIYPDCWEEAIADTVHARTPSASNARH